MIPAIQQWSYLPIFERLFLALALGLLVGIERERYGKEAGIRTFTLVSLLGALGGLIGESYAFVCIIVVLALLVIFLNLQTLCLNQGTELTTSVALYITGFVGILSGQGHTLTPTAVAIITVALLTWKEPLSGFSIKLSNMEFRSAILLGILAFVIYPALPEGSIDPWGAFEPRTAWLTIILIAGIGFVNYILLKIYGDRGIELMGFLGGFVNSTVTTRELAQRIQETHGEITETAYRGILLSLSAMIIRNALLLLILSPSALRYSAAAFSLMLVTVGSLAIISRKFSPQQVTKSVPSFLNLKSPFSLTSGLMFGSVLIIIQIAGVLSQHILGGLGVYITSLLGGFFSSASAVAAVATLASHDIISAKVAGNSAVIASLASNAVELPLIIGLRIRGLTTRLSISIGIITIAAGLGIFLQTSFIIS